MIDVAFAPFSPTKTECQYVKDVPIAFLDSGFRRNPDNTAFHSAPGFIEKLRKKGLKGRRIARNYIFATGYSNPNR